MNWNKSVILSLWLPAALALAVSRSAWASPVEIVKVSGKRLPDGWRFAVTLKHADSGWDHYADGWRILSPEKKLLGVRVLRHPHIKEQPFTRTLRGVKIPAGIKKVIIEAKDNLTDWKDASRVTYRLKLPFQRTRH